MLELFKIRIKQNLEEFTILRKYNTIKKQEYNKYLYPKYIMFYEYAETRL